MLHQAAALKPVTARRAIYRSDTARFRLQAMQLPTMKPQRRQTQQILIVRRDVATDQPIVAFLLHNAGYFC
jgi:hypothetical protein